MLQQLRQDDWPVSQVSVQTKVRSEGQEGRASSSETSRGILGDGEEGGSDCTDGYVPLLGKVGEGKRS